MTSFKQAHLFPGRTSN